MQNILQNKDPMKNIVINPRAAAIISIILALPFPVLFMIAWLEIEPFNGLLNTLFTEADGYRQNALGVVVTIGAALLLLAAFIVSLVPIARNIREGNNIVSNPLNLLLAVALLVVITMFVGGIIIDQYPCWIGVPNCD